MTSGSWLSAAADLLDDATPDRGQAGGTADVLAGGQRAGAHPETIRRAVRSGTPPASRVGRSLRIDFRELEAWLNRSPPLGASRASTAS